MPVARGGRRESAATRPVVRLLLAPWSLLAGCAEAPADAAAWGFVGLALLVVALGFYALGLWRERARGQVALARARAQAERWSALAGPDRWRSDAQHRLVCWPTAAGGGPGPPDAEALRAVLAAERPFRSLRLPAEAQRAAVWLLDGEPVHDDLGRFDGYVGCVRPAGPADDAAPTSDAVDALLRAWPTAALIARRHAEGWQVAALNPAARTHWPGLGAGAPLETAFEALPTGVQQACTHLGAEQSIEADGWHVARYAPPEAAATGEGLLLARLGTAATESSDFGPTLSHDLRAPVRVVEGFTRIVKEDYGRQLDRVANDHLDRVLAAATRMNLMIDALLTLARLSSQPLVRQPVNLSQLAAFVVEDLRRAAPEREVEMEIEPELTALGDPTLLRMLLENLLGNAWKYTARVPRARIALRRALHGGRACYEVVDNGAGFDMRSADRLFGLFQRLHSQSEFAGHGVGLASVRRIVKRHGGQVWAQAEPGRGATFGFTLG